MPTRKRQNRLSRILDELQLNRGATIKDLARRFEVSEMTIRRDLDALAGEEMVQVVPAGAIPSGKAFSLAEGSAAGAAESMRIGRKAASLLEAGDVVIIDSGGTTEWFARSIPPRISLTVICFALNILLEVSRGKERTVVLAGGALRGDTLVFESPEGASLLRRYRANKAFLSAGGVSATLGVTCAEPAEAELKKAAVASSQTRILLAESSRFDRVTAAWFADIRDFDAVVTDPGISLEYVKILRDLGITLHVVS